MKVKTEIKAGPDFRSGSMLLETDEDGFIQEPDKWIEQVTQ